MRVLSLLIAILAVAPATVLGQEVSFEHEVRPILAGKCFRCHGPDEGSREAGLRLDERASALEPAESGAIPIVAGKPDESELVRRIISTDDGERMPPADSKLELTDGEKETLVRWIADGAPYQLHWSLQPPRRPALPALQDQQWPQNPIDSFVLARLEADQSAPKKLTPAPRAEPYQLVRRLYLDLTGLPPTPEEADDFIRDNSPVAYQKLVDRLLASPAFGERMAWPWLDAARYADSNGYQGDAERTMWPWRDWAIAAFNRNLPFDQFTIWQIAGDRLPEATFEQRLATGFLRNHMINGEGGRIAEENRVEYVMDMSETVGTVWLGLTLNCCRCHDHKFDPLTRRDYYSMFAFFNQTPVDGGGGNPQTPPLLEVPSAEQQMALDQCQTDLDQLAPLITQREQELGAATGPANAEGLPEPIQQILALKVGERSNEQLDQLQKHFEGAASKPEDYLQQLAKWREVKERRANIQNAIPRVMVMQDLAERRPSYMLAKGLYNQPGDEVTANVPARLSPLDQQHPDRLALAQWLVAPDNPLTARVTVNRLWQQFFGAGLVKTTEDFGTQGELPSHPELLDWLAVELRDSGWDIKHICRLIVLSSTYQQSSKIEGSRYEQDPENRLLARGPRFRLPSWAIRDQALFTSGLLVAHVGGPPVHPYQPAGIWEDATFGQKSYPQAHGAPLYRRSVYTFWRRIVAPTMFFDVASRQVCTVKQPKTNTPLQALVTMNDVTYIEASRVLAERVLTSLPETASNSERISALFRRVLVRPPTADELHVLAQLQAELAEEFRLEPASTDKFLSVGESPRHSGLDAVQVAALAGVASALLNLDETLTKE